MTNTVTVSDVWDSDIAKHLIPIAWVDGPDADIAARGLGESQVIKLMGSFAKGIQMTSLNVVVLAYREDVIAAGYDPDNLEFNAICVDTPPFKIMAIFGLHSSVAMFRLHVLRPHNQDYHYIPVTFVICQHTAEDMLMAQLAGNLSNSLGALQKPQSVWDCILQMHNKIMEIHQSGDSAKDRKKLLVQARLHWVTSFPHYTTATIGSLSVIGKLQGQLWSNIQDIFTGNVVVLEGATGKAAPKEMGHGHFTDMAKIPEACLIRWTRRVIQGEITTRQFNERCKQYKKVDRIQKDVVTFVNQMYPQSECEDFEELQSEHKCFQDDMWFNSLVDWCGANARDGLTSSVKDSINARLRAIEMEKKAIDMNVRKSTLTSYSVLACFSFLFSICSCTRHTSRFLYNTIVGRGKRGTTHPNSHRVRRNVPDGVGTHRRKHSAVPLRCNCDDEHHPTDGLL